MKNIVFSLLDQAAKLAFGGFDARPFLEQMQIEPTKKLEHGDYAANLALLLAKPLQASPRELAQTLIQHLPASEEIDHVEIAGPGFINFFLADSARQILLQQIIQEGQNYGSSGLGQGQRILLEFVSANPTGPLHVGHGRSAAFGATLANLLRKTGHDVTCEYYVNDAGRQMNILAVSTWCRYLELSGESIPFPTNGYLGDYVIEIARTLHDSHPTEYVIPASKLVSGLPQDGPEGDQEIYIDALIARAKELLGQTRFQTIHQLALETILQGIQTDLAQFGVHYDRWFSEQQLFPDGVKQAVEQLKQNNTTYEEDGNLWFRSTQFGDEKDRVLIRKNGEPTYFAADVAHHLKNAAEGYDAIINILGADHHGYAPRVKAALEAVGFSNNLFKVLFVQFAILYRGKDRIQMSTRKGSFVTLAELTQEVGQDAARYFYIARKNEQHMDFDLELAKKQSQDNPIYYIQYAHARICSVFNQLLDKHLSFDHDLGSQNVKLLTTNHEQHLLRQLMVYPDLIQFCAKQLETHPIAHYLHELASLFHSYYNGVQFLVEETNLRCARLALIQAVRDTLHSGLELLNIEPKTQM